MLTAAEAASPDWRCAAAVLLLGNVTFAESGDAGQSRGR